MPVKIKTIIKPDIPGLKSAEGILAQEYAKAGLTIGEEGIKRVRKLQRIDTGQERRRTAYRIASRKTQINVELYNTSIQAAVDETGAKAHFPPYKAGSNLFRWVSRKGLAPKPTRQTRQEASRGLRGVEARVTANKDAARRVKQIESISFLIARAISRRGLPRPGDPLRSPFATVSKTFGAYSRKVIDRATFQAVSRINKGQGKK